jgi:hypothetical protein
VDRGINTPAARAGWKLRKFMPKHLLTSAHLTY